MPDFTRYAARRPNRNTVNESCSQFNEGDRWARASAYMTGKWAEKPRGTAFCRLSGRDNLFERMHGLPKESKEEKAMTVKKNKNRVNFTDFLPNSIKKSAKTTFYSASNKTKAMGLFNLEQHSTLHASLRHGQTTGLNSQTHPASHHMSQAGSEVGDGIFSAHTTMEGMPAAYAAEPLSAGPAIYRVDGGRHSMMATHNSS